MGLFGFCFAFQMPGSVTLTAAHASPDVISSDNCSHGCIAKMMPVEMWLHFAHSNRLNQDEFDTAEQIGSERS